MKTAILNGPLLFVSVQFKLISFTRWFEPSFVCLIGKQLENV